MRTPSFFTWHTRYRISPITSDYPKDTPEHYIVPSDEPYSDKDWPQIAKNYAAMITRMDHDVGRIMELIKKLGIDENTIVFFTSDNGPYKGSPIPIEFFDKAAYASQ
ncbi:MAG: sulfatase-like hydrolase/transferase [Planctomycetota bacterium]